MKRNPFSPEVPCHRVIASDLTVGGFKGSGHGPHVSYKLSMLAAEGVVFKHGKLQDARRICDSLELTAVDDQFSPDALVGKDLE